MSKAHSCYLIFGASSAIANAVIQKLIEQPNNDVYAFSRNAIDVSSSQVHSITVEDYSAINLKAALKPLEISKKNIVGVYIFNGILHSDKFRPEKALSQFNPDTFSAVIAANTITPISIIQAVLSLCEKSQQFKIAALSARIGSISDNGLGGWHSYRASKAALNMLLQNITIECARSYKGIKLISYHPGTTDSPLSKPFQANVPSEQLFSAEKSADFFINVVEKQPYDNQLSYVDWQGNIINW